MNKVINSRIASRNYGQGNNNNTNNNNGSNANNNANISGPAAAAGIHNRPSGQSNLFGQKNQSVQYQVNHPQTSMIQTRSQTSMLMGIDTSHSASKPGYLNQPSGDFLHRGNSPKQPNFHHLQQSKPISSKITKKGASKVKVTTSLNHQPNYEPLSGGLSGRSNQNNGHNNHNNFNTTAANLNYSQKTFYSAYIGANSFKGSTIINSQASSFAGEKGRNLSNSTANMTINNGGNNTNSINQRKNQTASKIQAVNNTIGTQEMKTSQTQAHLSNMNTVQHALNQIQLQQSVNSNNINNQTSSITMSSSRLLTNLDERFNGQDGGSGAKTSKTAAAAVAAARVNANINAAAAQNVQKLAVPDLAQKLLKTQMSLDLKGLTRLAHQTKQQKSGGIGGTSKAQKSSRVIAAQNKVSIVLNNQQWEQVQPSSFEAQQLATKSQYATSIRSMSRKREEKGVTKTGKKLGTREPSISSVLHEKHLIDSGTLQLKNSITQHSIRHNKKNPIIGLQSSLKTSAAKQRRGIQNELLATLNIKSYQKGLITSQHLSAQNSQRTIVSPKQRGLNRNSFKNPITAGKNHGGGVSFEGLTPKQTTKAYQRVHNMKTDSNVKSRASKNSMIHLNNNVNAETTNCSYNQYGIAEASSNSLGNNLPNSQQQQQQNSNYMITSPTDDNQVVSPLMMSKKPQESCNSNSGNKQGPQVNYRHKRVQSNIADGNFNTQQRVNSQSALGLISSSSTYLGLTSKNSTQPLQLQLGTALSKPNQSRVSLPITTSITTTNAKTRKGQSYQKQIQEKIRQLQMKYLTAQSSCTNAAQQQVQKSAAHAVEGTTNSQAVAAATTTSAASDSDRNVMNVLNQINRRMEMGNQSSLVGQPAKKLSSRASIHKISSQLGHHNDNDTQKQLQEKLIIKKAQDKLGGKSLNNGGQNGMIRESKTTKDLLAGHMPPSQSILGSRHQYNQSMTTLPANTSVKRQIEKKKKAGDAADNAGSRLGNSRPLSQIELVGVYKYTRNQQKTRLQRAIDCSPQRKITRASKVTTSISTTQLPRRNTTTLQASGGRANQDYASMATTQQSSQQTNTKSGAGSSSKLKSSSRPASQMRTRLDKVYKQYCDSVCELGADNNNTAPPPHHKDGGAIIQNSNKSHSQQQQQKQSRMGATQKAKGSSKVNQSQQQSRGVIVQQQRKQAAAATSKLAAVTELEQWAELEQKEIDNQEETVVRKRIGKSASIKRKRQEPLASSQQHVTAAALLHAATNHKFKEDILSVSDNEHEETIGELGVQTAKEIENSKRRKTRGGSEPPRYYQSIVMQKMYNEADLLVLEDRSNSRVRSFKIFDDKRVFPEIYENDEFQPLDKEEKHDECDYDTEPEHVVKARELMLEDLTESIKFYVEEQPLDLVYNIHRKYK